MYLLFFIGRLGGSIPALVLLINLDPERMLEMLSAITKIVYILTFTPRKFNSSL